MSGGGGNVILTEPSGPPARDFGLPATPEDEIAAMTAIAEAFSRLDLAAQERVAQWTASRFGRPS